MFTTLTNSLRFASLLLCLTLCLAACSSVPPLQPSHPVEVTHYETLKPSANLTQPVRHCTLNSGATWKDAWSAYLCSDAQITLANCRLASIGGTADPACDALLKGSLDDSLVPGGG